MPLQPFTSKTRWNARHRPQGGRLCVHAGDFQDGRCQLDAPPPLPRAKRHPRGRDWIGLRKTTASARHSFLESFLKLQPIGHQVRKPHARRDTTEAMEVSAGSGPGSASGATAPQWHLRAPPPWRAPMRRRGIRHAGVFLPGEDYFRSHCLRETNAEEEEVINIVHKHIDPGGRADKSP